MSHIIVSLTRRGRMVGAASRRWEATKRSFEAFSAWVYRDAFVWRPGYWGSLPYLLLLRCLVAAGVWLRFWIHSDHPLPAWTYTLLLAAVVVAVLLHGPAREKYSRRL